MKRYLILLDFDGTLVDRGSKGVHDKIPFHDLTRVSELYKQDFDIEIEFKILTSSCAKSIEDVMTVSEMSCIGEWLFENGLHVRRYSDLYDKVHESDAVSQFHTVKPEIISWLDGVLDMGMKDVLQSLSDKKASLAIHLKHSQNEVFHALRDIFGAQCTIIQSGQQTIEVFPKGHDKSWVLSQLDLSVYESVVFIGDSIYPGGNDFAVAESPLVDFSIEVKSPRDSARLLRNMQAKGSQKPFDSSILNGTQARVVQDRRHILTDEARFFKDKKYILLDFDGTLTYENGQVYPKILEVLRELSLNYEIWIITGRSMGWADMMINAFPIKGVIGENGAFAFYWDEQRQRIRLWQTKHLPPDYKPRLAHLKRQITENFPYISFASDQFSREHDIAAVTNEHGETLSSEQMKELMFWVRGEGATAAISNIHLNIWFGEYNKAQTVIELFNEVYQVCNFELCRRSFYIGDSPNDEPMFRLIEASFGVRNVEAFLDRLRYKPAAISRDPEGFGSYDILRSILIQKKISMPTFSDNRPWLKRNFNS